MTDYEKSLEAAVNGNLDALGLLQSNAKQGDADAQFCLSRYYLAVRDMDNYNYWSEKAYQNGYIDDESIIKEGNKEHNFFSLGLIITGIGLLLVIATEGQIIWIGLIIAGLSLIIINR